MNEEEYLSGLQKSGFEFSLPREKLTPALQKLHAAIVQIDRAIALYLDEEDYICAITLAGASDGILREMSRHEFNVDDLGGSAELVALLGKRIGSKSAIDPRSVIHGELLPTNWLKHYGAARGKSAEVMAFDLEESANIVVDRAITSLEIVEEALITAQPIGTDGLKTSPMRRFLEHIGRCD